MYVSQMHGPKVHGHAVAATHTQTALSVNECISQHWVCRSVTAQGIIIYQAASRF